MKKRQRIEITAVRRRITVVTGDAPSASANEQPLQNSADQLWSTVANLLPPKQTDLIRCQIKPDRSPETTQIIETSLGSDSDALAAKGVGLRAKSFRLRLRCAWIASLKRLRNRLDKLRGLVKDRRPLKQTTRDANQLPSDIEEIHHE